jgi:protein required for attachment to host cells
MRKHLRLLIVIADGEHARFVRPSENHALHSKAHMDAETAHEQKSDRGDDLHDLETVRFAHLVSHRVSDLAAQDAFDDLVIAAPPHSFAAIRDKLNVDTEIRVIGTLAKDLMTVPDLELSEHFKAWVRQVHRAEH